MACSWSWTKTKFYLSSIFKIRVYLIGMFFVIIIIPYDLPPTSWIIVISQHQLNFFNRFTSISRILIHYKNSDKKTYLNVHTTSLDRGSICLWLEPYLSLILFIRADLFWVLGGDWIAKLISKMPSFQKFDQYGYLCNILPINKYSWHLSIILSWSLTTRKWWLSSPW